MINSALDATRIAALALNQYLSQFGNQAEWYDGDDPTQWAVVNYQEVRAIKHERLNAEIHLLGSTITIYIPDIHECIRSEHLGEFDYTQYGIRHRPNPQPITRYQAPQLIVEMPYPDQEDIPKGERIYIPTRTTKSRAKLKRQYEPYQ